MNAEYAEAFLGIWKVRCEMKFPKAFLSCYAELGPATGAICVFCVICGCG